MHLVLKFWLWGRFVAEKQTYVLNLMAGHLLNMTYNENGKLNVWELDHYADRSSLGIHFWDLCWKMVYLKFENFWYSNVRPWETVQIWGDCPWSGMVDICKGAFLKLDDKVSGTKLRQFRVKICGEADSKCAATHRHRNSRCWVGLQSELQRRKRMLPVNRRLVKRPSQPQGKDQYSSWSLHSYNSITSSQTCPSGSASTSPHSPRQPTEKRSWRSSRAQRWANNNHLFSQYT